jgi:RNA polymerase sigma-70 factor (ECF subfamily)
LKILELAQKELLIKIATESDEKAFEILFNRYYKRILRFSIFLTNSKEFSEEIVLDVFYNIWQQREKLVEILSFESYLFTCAKNLSLNYIDKLNRKPTTLLTPLHSNSFHFSDTPEEQLISKEKFSAIQKAIDCLPPKCGLIFEMIFVDNLKYKEVATLLGISVKTVEAQMAIAMKRITNNLRKSDIF